MQHATIGFGYKNFRFAGEPIPKGTNRDAKVHRFFAWALVG